eukprot:symbB.v1.2.026761.t1/scaffold2700.1/size72752/6
MDFGDALAAEVRCEEGEEGPPGPAGEKLALPSSNVVRSKEASFIRLNSSLAWLQALQANGLSFDRFYLGLGGLQDAGPRLSGSGVHCLRNVSNVPVKLNLIVLIQKVEMLCGQLELLVRDHTSLAHATVDPRVSQAWPRAISEGNALVLNTVTAIPDRLGVSLLITSRCIQRVFRDEAEEEVAAALLAAADFD